MTVLSLFDGIACGMIAAKNAGLDVDSYDAYEIDKYAIQTATHNFPEIKEHGDIFKADFSQYKNIDFILGCSPCTFWSVAQKINRETTASGLGWELFSQYVKGLKEVKPKYFIYENNKSMSKEIRNSIRDTFGFEEFCINSALVSAQNRNRLYWVGKYNPKTDWYDKVDVIQPNDLGIKLQDVLDSGVAMQDKSYCIMASEYKGGPIQHTLQKHVRTQVAEFVGEITTEAGNVLKEDIRRARPCEWDNSGKPIKAISKANGKTYPVYKIIDNTICIKGESYAINLKDGYWIIRKLTVNECKRLQTVPDWYEFPVSNSQALKQLGNGWTCDVITHLIKSCLKDFKK